MRILEYHYRDIEGPGWDFAKVNFGKINLLVGDSATGKSRFLNTFFNLGRFVAAKEFKSGSWDLVFEHAGVTYTWQIEAQKGDDDRKPGVIIKDNLWKHDGQNLVPLIERDNTRFSFGGQRTPKLSPQETSISLLREEETIQPLYEAFSVIERRLFGHDALETAISLHSLPARLVEIMEKERDLKKLFSAEVSLSSNLFLLSRYFNDIYRHIIEYYKRVFPFIREARVTNLADLEPNLPMRGEIPVFVIQERESNRWIPVNQFSSGMLKVLLILTDIFIMPDGGVYIIDEYENSLGINAIGFFPQFVLELEKDVQFFLTSHHPYLINEMPVTNWYVFHRKGMQVFIRHGQELEERLGKSKQQAFIRLINDPFFNPGVE